MYLDVSISVRDLRQKKSFNSSSGSCHGSDVTWQEIGHMCGSVYTGQNLQLWIGSLIEDRGTRWIKEAVHIRKQERRSVNPDEGSYTPSHTNDRFLATSHHYRGKSRKKN